MTMPMNDHDPLLRRQLRALPDPAAPAGLRERVLAAHGRRRLAIHGATGVAAAVVAVALILPALPSIDPAPSGAQHAAAPAPSRSNEVAARLRAIDRALQAAYERGASDDEIAPLWRVRESLMSSLGPATDSGNPS